MTAGNFEPTENDVPSGAAQNEQLVMPSPMDKAPKDKLILLHFPHFGLTISTWWVGQWSWVNSRWAIRTPFSQNGKLVMVVDVPEPTEWLPLPEA